MDNNKKDYKSSNFYLAAYLTAKGIRLARVDKSDPRRFLFIFEDLQSATKQAENYNFGRNCTVNAKEFVNSIKNLKSIILN